MLIQIHMLQNYAPSNLNRDNTGSPKDAYFGGLKRGRISSQCLKRSIRHSEPFEPLEREGLLGKRTQMLPGLVENRLKEMGVEDVARQAILARLPDIIRGGKSKDEEDQPAANEEASEEAGDADDTAEDSKQLIFLDMRTELSAFAAHLVEAYRAIGPKDWPKQKKHDKLKVIFRLIGESLPRSLDIAMFGRMTTSAAFRDVQAAVQVAHALSTNKLDQEFDYYTAMDDLKPDTVPGADMVGDIEFNSCTYYKYLNIHWEELVKNLGGDLEIARRGVGALLEAAATGHPTGKQNSFAAFNLPDFVLVEVSDRNLPVSYANAFLRPVNGLGKSLMENSVDALSDYVEKVSRVYDLAPTRRFLSLDRRLFLGAKPEQSLSALGAWLTAQLPE